MSGLHSKCGGSPVAHAYPRTAKYFFRYLLQPQINRPDKLPQQHRTASPITHTRAPAHTRAAWLKTEPSPLRVVRKKRRRDLVEKIAENLTEKLTEILNEKLTEILIENLLEKFQI